MSSKYNKREKVAYVETNGYLETYLFGECVEDSKVYVAELNPGPPYVWKVLKAYNGKNPIEPIKNEKLITKIYTFDITKCEEFFICWLLWAYYSSSGI